MMRKIKDRFIAGIVAGLLANFSKQAIEWTAYSLGISKEVGCEKSAGFFLPKSEVETPMGRAIGIVADNSIAVVLGILGVYVFTLAGSDHAVLKGLTIGNASWSAAYGVLSRMGATTQQTMDAKTTIVSWIAHTVFGGMKGYLLTALCDPELFGNPPLRPRKRKAEFIMVPMDEMSSFHTQPR